MAIEMTYFADKAPNKLAENRSALSTPDTSSVAKCSRLTTSGRVAHLEPLAQDFKDYSPKTPQRQGAYGTVTRRHWIPVAMPT